MMYSFQSFHESDLMNISGGFISDVHQQKFSVIKAGYSTCQIIQ